jgi:hypothetical protein
MIAYRPLLRVLVLLCVTGGLLLAWSAPALAQREHEFSTSFGTEGSGDGQFTRPGASAVNESTGDVYVADQGNARVEVFDAKGKYLFQFNGGSTPTGSFSWKNVSGLNGGVEASIAIDNSTNPLDSSKGDVYIMNNQPFGQADVVDKFSSTGAYIGSVTGTSPTSSSFPLGNPGGVDDLAVDPNGELWVQDGTNSTTAIYRFNNAAPVNEYIATLTAKTRGRGGSSGGFGDIGLAIDSTGDFYIGLDPESSGQPMFPTKLSNKGEILAETLAGNEEATTGLAVDLSSDDVYLDQETSIAAYNSSNALVERFGSPQLAASEGIAVDSATGTVYASDASNQDINVFTAFIVPEVSTGSASSLAETSAMVNGVVNPDGVPIASCVFEYRTEAEASYGHSAPCSQTPTQIGAGSSPVTVSLELTGLEPLTRYHFRLNVSNNSGSSQGGDQTFTTPEPVTISEESVSDISSVSAQFNVQLNPGGANTSYHFEYGTSASYGENVPVPAGELGPSTSSEPVAIDAQNLLTDTTYHFRLVASNVLGTVYGPDETFTTEAAGGAFALPDGREWEMVSPPNKGGALIAAIGGGIGTSGSIRSSLDGNAFTYYANGPIGSNVAGNPSPQGPVQVLSERGAGGWSSEDIDLPNSAALSSHFGNEYDLFSSDLSHALVESLSESPLSPEATENTPYLRDDGSSSYLPLLTAGNVVPPGTTFGPLLSTEPEVEPKVLAATPNLSHVIFRSPYALTTTATLLPERRGPNLYEWAEGQLQQVNLPPAGRTAPVEAATLGGNGSYNKRNAISNDGSRVFFEANEGEVLYERNMVTKQTVELPGEFQTASADGSKVFVLSGTAPGTEGNTADGELYVYDTVTESLTDLSADKTPGETANVQQDVVGASEDGSVVYFVATGVLAGGAEPGKDNLYVATEVGATWSPPRLVAVLSPEDKNDWGGINNRSLEGLSSRVSSSGRYLAFMSEQSLTGYDNRDAHSGERDEEVFLYDEATGHLACVSCNPTGARPDGVQEPPAGSPSTLLVDERDLWPQRWLAASIPGWTPDIETFSQHVEVESRLLSSEGRLFFDSADALVPQDTNGKDDVYEFEPQGVGDCTRVGGCVALISAGTAGEESAFLDASGKGPGGEEAEDVFFLTTSRLVSQDVDSSFDVYDAHVCSAAAPCPSAPVSPPPCTTGDSCKAAPSPQPAIFGAPGSSTFSGAGNVAPTLSTPSIASKRLTQTQKLATALKACRKKSGRKRAVCESRARKKYRVKAKAKKDMSSSSKGRR